jgi:hypothetical protein
MYTFDEVLPYMYDDIEKSPKLKNGLFENDNDEAEFLNQMSDLMHEPFEGEYVLTIPNFSITVDESETSGKRTFEAHKFIFEVTKAEKIHDDYCEGKAWSHYETYMKDTATGQKYVLISEYYETNQDLIGIYIDKIKTPVKKAKKVKTMFVVVARTPEDYNILGMFDSLKKAVEAEDGNKSTNIQIEEVPINCKLTFSSNESDNMITGALNVFDLKGNPI